MDYPRSETVAAELLQSSSNLATPCHLISEKILLGNSSRFRDVFSISTHTMELAFSVKTCPIPFVVSTLEADGWSFLCSSEHELAIVPNETQGRVYYDGVFKPEREIDLVNKVGGTIILDGSSQISVFAERNHECAEYGIRVHVPSAISGVDSKFGFECSEASLKAAAPILHRIRPTILQFHLEWGSNSPSAFKALGDYAFQCTSLFNSAGCDIRKVDLGGGFPAFSETEDLEGYRSALESAICTSAVSSEVTIMLEPGRAIAETAGFVATTVIDVREYEGKKFVVVDAGTNLVMPQWMTGESRQLVSTRGSLEGRDGKDEVIVCGPLCAENDVILATSGSPEVFVGDRILVCATGAYDWSTRYFFGRSLPAAYAITDDGTQQLVVHPVTPKDLYM